MAGAKEKLFERFSEERVKTALRDTPVVMVNGPRQCGKTTLVRRFVEDDRAYITLDDDTQLEAARGDPAGFMRGVERAVIDEVQRAPELLRAIKRAVDEDRRPGRFLLTGSANVLTLPQVAESLAGRMEVVSLLPLSRAEIRGARPTFLDKAFSSKVAKPLEIMVGADLVNAVLIGGYPEMLTRDDPKRRQAWAREYVDAIVQRDVRELARIGSLDALPRLLALAASQTARLLNVSELAAPFQLSRPTIRDYVTLLTRVFLVEELPPWHSNRLSRLVKTPKLHVGDTGLACALLGADTAALMTDRQLLGQLLETFVFHELKRQASWHDNPLSFFHFRDRDDFEVDIVMERGVRAVSGVEVKAGATVTAADFRGLRKLREAAGKRFSSGVVLYDGEICAGFGDAMFAVPIRSLWEAS